MNESIRGLNAVKEETKFITPNKKEMSGIIENLIQSIKKQQQIEAKIDSTDLLDKLSGIHYNIGENLQKVIITNTLIKLIFKFIMFMDIWILKILYINY